MPIWTTVPVTLQPQLKLVRWQVVELPDGDRHLVGYVVENCEGRVSSAIKTMDLARMCATTSTGRVYALSGPPGHDSDAEYVWDIWARINFVSESIDVTADVWAAHVAAIKAHQ